MLPAWLGLDEALGDAAERGDLAALAEMYEGWPFFRSTLDLVEMVLAKASPDITGRYDERLLPEPLQRTSGRGFVAPPPRSSRSAATERCSSTTPCFGARSMCGTPTSTPSTSFRWRSSAACAATAPTRGC